MHKKNISIEEKEIFLRRISAILEAREDIHFAYVFGSLVYADSFRDVDIGIFADMNKIVSLRWISS